MKPIETQVKKLYSGTDLDHYETEGDTITVYLNSTKKSAVCPCCRAESHSVHSVYVKKFADLPLNGMFTECRLTNRIFTCRNKACEKKGGHFGATYDWINLEDHKTYRLINWILDETLTNTVRGASKALAEAHIKADCRTISRLKAAHGMRKSDMKDDE